ncbi:MAG TPA: phosphatidylserine/phosphatidylglycerophosphate/cardiolipin synthase family protein [Polyangia bacterium]
MMVAAGTSSSIVLLDRGSVAFARMLSAIRAATRTVHLEVYAISTGGVGGLFIAALGDAARRGVHVRVVIDAWGTGYVASGVAATLRAAGCDATVYNPIWRGVLYRQRRRNHRKLLVVDERVAFVGGINLVDEFVGERAWADVAVEIHGTASAHLAHRLRHEPHPERENGVRVLLSDVGGSRRLRRRYLKAVGAARRSILLAHSYFLPDRGFLRSLTAAARRGVQVKLLVPGHSDVPLARATTALLYRRLLRAGVQVYELAGAILHAKLGVFDDTRLLVGSFNLDPYSLADLEVLVDARDPRVAAEATTWIDGHLEHALAITDARPRGGRIRRLWERLKGELGWWLARTVGRLMSARR